MAEKKKGLDGKACWKGYKLAGTKKKGGKTVDNCVKEGKSFQQFCLEAAIVAEQSGDGYMGPPALKIKNPMASDATRAAGEAKRKTDAKARLAAGGKTSGGIANRIQQRADMINSIGEEYKELKKTKVGMKAGKKIVSAVGHAGKAGAEEEGTIENQIRMQKAGKKAKQADRMHDVAKKHNPTLSKMKSLKNKLTGKVKKDEKK